MNNYEINKLTNKLFSSIYILSMIILIYYTSGPVDGYSPSKKNAFYILTAISLLPLFVSIISTYIQRPKELIETVKLRQVRYIYCFSFIYLAILIISSIFSFFPKEAISGTNGWYMGLATLAIMLLGMFMLSIAIDSTIPYILLLILSASVICVFCILSRFGVNVFHIYDDRQLTVWYTYLPFLGQKNWFAAFIAIVYPIVLGIFLTSENKKLTIFSIVNSLFIVPTLALQGSDSIYISILFVFIFFFVFYIKDLKTLCRYMYMLTLFVGSLQLTGIFLDIFKEKLIPLSNSVFIICASKYSRLLFVLLIFISLALFIARKKGLLLSKPICIFKIAVYAIIIMAFISILILVYIVTKYRTETKLYYILPRNFFLFDSNWGTNRGANWRYAYRTFKELSLPHKLIGIGPDCYNAYAQAYHPEFAFHWTYGLANAHNEAITTVVNTGLLGLISYYGIYISAIVSGLKNRKSPYILPLCAAVIGSMFNNLFSFMTICSTVWMFIIIAFIIIEIKKGQ